MQEFRGREEGIFACVENKAHQFVDWKLLISLRITKRPRQLTNWDSDILKWQAFL
jgi:hypothetical protein